MYCFVLNTGCSTDQYFLCALPGKLSNYLAENITASPEDLLYVHLKLLSIKMHQNESIDVSGYQS